VAPKESQLRLSRGRRGSRGAQGAKSTNVVTVGRDGGPAETSMRTWAASAASCESTQPPENWFAGRELDAKQERVADEDDAAGERPDASRLVGSPAVRQLGRIAGQDGGLAGHAGRAPLAIRSSTAVAVGGSSPTSVSVSPLPDRLDRGGERRFEVVQRPRVYPLQRRRRRAGRAASDGRLGSLRPSSCQRLRN
jgi:hypothetical protein